MDNMDNMENEIKRIENGVLMLRGMIKDFTCAADEMENFLKMVKDPIQVIYNNNLSEDLDGAVARMQIHFLMGINKINAYNNYMSKQTEDE